MADGSGSASAAAAAAAEEHKLYDCRADITVAEALKIYTGQRGLDGLPIPAKPKFVLLYGPPGSGKSTALSRVQALTELNPADAVTISLDALVESVRTFCAETTAIGLHAKNALERGNQATVDENFKAAAKPYLGMMMAKGNNRPGAAKGAKVMSLNEIRKEALQVAVEAGKNIIYERTGSGIFEKELFEVLQDKYTIYVVYPRIDERELQSRLVKRPFQQLEETPSFFRVVAPALAGRFIGESEAYLQTIKGFKTAGQIQDIFILAPDGSRLAEGGRRKTRRHKQKQKRCARSTRLRMLENQ